MTDSGESKTKTWIRLVHVAKNQCKLSDDAYRSLLEGAAGIKSAKDIQTEDQFETVMQSFQALGFARSPAKKRLPVKPEQQGTNCSPRQLYYIKGLWELASKARDEKSLQRMVKRIGGVDDLRFLSKKNASAVILALRTITWKAGFNPDYPPKATGGSNE